MFKRRLQTMVNLRLKDLLRLRRAIFRFRILVLFLQTAVLFRNWLL